MEATMDVERLRRMVNEPTETTYDDELLAATIARYPLLDGNGRAPDDPEWTPAYDHHAAAALIWEEKAAQWAGLYDFSTDGGQYVRNQAYRQHMELARFHAARRAPRTVTAYAWPAAEMVDGQLFVVDAE
jgi:hypothetical protein